MKSFTKGTCLQKASEPARDCRQGSAPVILAVIPNINNPVLQQAESLSTDYHEELGRLLGASEIVQEARRIGNIAGPMVLVGLLLYTKAMISMLFLGQLGELELAGGSLAMGFANMTGYSVLSGLAMGMEPICAQAFGAKRWSLMGLALQRTILILVCFCAPIALLWINGEKILLQFKQDPAIVAMAGVYLRYCLPDLLAQAVLNPLRIYLRTQNITGPLACCAACALALHVFINLVLLRGFGMGIQGIALSNALTSFNLVILLASYMWLRPADMQIKSWGGWTWLCLEGWESLLRIAIPSCVSVCLEWWWYELIILLSGWLPNARSAVATTGLLIQTTSLVYIFPSALSLAVSTRVGNELGANRPGHARFAALVALGCSLLMGALAATFTISVRHVWGSLFTADRGVIQLTATVMPLLGLCELGNCPQTTGCGVLRGSSRPSAGANINLASFYCLGLPVALLSAFHFQVGFMGLWLGLLSAQATCVALMLTVLLKTDWKEQATRANQLIMMETGDNNNNNAGAVKKLEALMMRVVVVPLPHHKFLPLTFERIAIYWGGLSKAPSTFATHLIFSFIFTYTFTTNYLKLLLLPTKFKHTLLRDKVRHYFSRSNL